MHRKVDAFIFGDVEDGYPGARGDLIVYVRGNGEIHYRYCGVWRPFRPWQAATSIIRVELPRGVRTPVKFPVACNTDQPAVIAVGRLKDNFNTLIGVSISDINRSGFTAYSEDDDCTLEFSYGDPKIV